MIVEQLVVTHAGSRGALLPLLHAIQREIGFIPDEAVPMIAAGLNLSRADVHGVVTFYHDFRRQPAGRHVVKFCRAEACQARGSAAIETAMALKLGVAMGDTRDDGHISLEAVYCLGLCATGPNAMVDGQPFSRIDHAAVSRIADMVSV
ncbi:formate dehydrogenase subunit gamma (plasmid) [Sphingomonas paeninsulae]|uniref:Formate dehydrogenase subunit gamma n=1 Tax=Sphingomonas paeninsulae TaxID=2319844 RepID=A0A494THZ5_SPHPE|nr:formate dehydrogenase subunit gamma [Sphingomonas paeninsulae]AYJ85456.1 formate dehydrogenase subunit gamma [Sphingomonas paeninsulae]